MAEICDSPKFFLLKNVISLVLVKRFGLSVIFWERDIFFWSSYCMKFWMHVLSKWLNYIGISQLVVVDIFLGLFGASHWSYLENLLARNSRYEYSWGVTSVCHIWKAMSRMCVAPGCATSGCAIKWQTSPCTLKITRPTGCWQHRNFWRTLAATGYFYTSKSLRS